MEKTLYETHHQLGFVDLLLIINDLSNKLLDIHNAGVIHCDINLCNIMSDKNGKYQFIDFGYSFLDESCPSDNHRRVGKAMDVFMFSKEMNSLIQQHLKAHPAFLTEDLQESAENIARDYDINALEFLNSKKEIQQLQSRIEAVLSEIKSPHSPD
jgi:tRNA A-37 threonylcarbamoyl transferase component Bud32